MGGPTDSLFLLCPVLSFLCRRRQWGDMNTGHRILSLSKLLGRVWPGEVSLGLGIGTSRIGRGTQKPLSLGAEAAAGPNLRPRYSFPGSQVYTSWLSLCLSKSQRVPEVYRWASVLAWCLGGSQLL